MADIIQIVTMTLLFYLLRNTLPQIKGNTFAFTGADDRTTGSRVKNYYNRGCAPTGMVDLPIYDAKLSVLLNF